MLSRFLFIGTVLAVSVNVYLFRNVATTGIVLFFLLFSLLLTVGYGLKKQKELLLLLTSIVALGSLAIVRAASFPQLVLVGGIFTSLMMYWYLNVVQSNFLSALSELFLIPFSLAGSYLSASIEFIGKAVHVSRTRNKADSNPMLEWLPSLIVGIVAGIPIVGILLVLFSSADPIFSKTIEHAFSTFTISELGVRFLVSIAVFLCTLPIAFMKIKKEFVSPTLAIIPQSAVKPITVIMSMVAITLGLFIVIQWPYVFAHVAQEQNLTTFGIATYSEYVKRGFGEFLVSAAFIYSVVWIGLLAHRHTFKKKHTVLFIIQTSVIILFSIFLLSIGRRVFLYWEFHGLTVIRLYGSLFLLWIGFLTTTLYLRHFFQWKWIQIEIIGSLLLLMTIGLVNAEHFIVTHHPPTVNGTVDTVYLTRLSADGYEGWKQAYTQSTNTIRELQNKKENLNEEDRRKAAYAGITLGLLNRHYYNLIKYYGTDTERQIFAEKMMTLLHTDIEETTKVFSQSLELLQQTGDQATISAQAYISEGGQSRSYTIIEHLTGLRTLASESATLLNQSNNRELFTRLAPRSPYTLGEYNSSLCQHLFYTNLKHSKQDQNSSCVPNFYNLVEENKTQHLIDKLLHWNIQEQLVYKRIIVDIPIEDMATAEQEYTTVWKRILHQPKDQQAYPRDISYDAPFVAPLW